VSGFFEMAGKPFPFSFWPSQESALAHLGRSDARACSLALADARQRNSSTPAFLQALRAQLGNAMTSSAPSIDAFARDLALSPRTLQRRLAEQKTSFAAEVQLARIEAAGRLLLHSNLTVIEIALELGFRSPQHFATLFRKHMGVTPTAFRSVSAKK
jgi:AraC-like DNA-binding protein